MRIISLVIFLLLMHSSFLFSQEIQRSHNIFASGIYCKETRDEPWSIKLICNITSLSGIFVVVHDAESNVIFKSIVPRGKYPEDKPYIVNIPEDEKTGEYKIVMMGHQKDIGSVNMPVTNLKYEVYGGKQFAVKKTEPATKVFLKVPAKTKMRFGGYKGHMAISEVSGDIEKIIFDTEKIGKGEGRGFKSKSQASWYYRMDVELEPEKIYGVIRKSCFYFQSDKDIFLVFTPEKWFYPSKKLQDAKWWEKIK